MMFLTIFKILDPDARQNILDTLMKAQSQASELNLLLGELLIKDYFI